MNNFQIEKIVRKLKKENQKSFVLKIDQFGRPLVALNLLTGAGKIEQHDWATDITCFLEGEGKFERGGKILDKVFRSKGEWRGSGLKGNVIKINIRPGTIIITEAGIPHRTTPQKNNSLAFITYKQYTKNYKIS